MGLCGVTAVSSTVVLALGCACMFVSVELAAGGLMVTGSGLDVEGIGSVDGGSELVVVCSVILPWRTCCSKVLISL